MIYNFFVNFKFPSFKSSKNDGENRFDISQIQNENNDFFNKFRDTFINNFLSGKVFELKLSKDNNFYPDFNSIPKDIKDIKEAFKQQAEDYKLDK